MHKHRDRTLLQVKKRDLACISSHATHKFRVSSVTLSAYCELGSRSVESLAIAARAAYGHTSVSKRLRCVRAFQPLSSSCDDVGILAFFEGCRIVSTGPTEEVARRLLAECRCAKPSNNIKVSNVFASGLLESGCRRPGVVVDLVALQKIVCAREDDNVRASFDGPRARSVLRITTTNTSRHCSSISDIGDEEEKCVQLDVYTSGRFTVKAPSEEEARKAVEDIVVVLKDFARQKQ